MAQTNFTPILTYKSDTATSVPSAGNLTNSTNGAELAVNTADKRLFTKDSGGHVVEVGTNPSSLTMPNGTANGVVYANGSKVLTSGSALVFDGTNLGIGNTSPTSYNSAADNLVIGTSGSNGMTIVSGSTSSGYIMFADGTTGQQQYEGQITYDHTSNFMAFNTSGAEGLRLTSSSLYTASGINVGIGTSSPAAKLNVNGTALFNGTTKITGEAVEIQGDVALGDYSAYATSNYRDIIYSASTASFGNQPTAYIRFQTTSDIGSAILFATRSSAGDYAERLRLDQVGNLGLGVTPSAWNTGGKALQFSAGSIYSYGSGASGEFDYAYNAYFDGGWKYTASSSGASLYSIQPSVYKWFIAPSGTAGDAISFTQAMTLDASGNLGVGTTSIASGGAGTVNVNFHTPSANSVFLKLSNTGTGNTASDGFDLIADSSGNSYVFNRENSALIFGTNATERARITSAGFFKATNTGGYVSSTGSSHELRSDVADEYVVRVTNSNASPGAASTELLSFTASAPNNTSAYFLDCTDNSARRAYILSNGGIANYAANNVILSDRREKTNFAPAISYLDKICAIPVQTFNYIDQNLEEDDGLTLGVVAQDVQAVAPELVSEGNWGTKENPKMRLEIYQTDLQYALMKALQELNAKFEAYKASHP